VEKSRKSGNVVGNTKAFENRPSPNFPSKHDPILVGSCRYSLLLTIPQDGGAERKSVLIVAMK